ncbi:MAG: twin-arginine translocase TatA/TatE family subunit [Mobiluncus porci]|uniref:Sec-independent protein translocase protein TatA n=1 Tax=Mobiluncus porci TaxID=2652278 RepID=A0A7K0K610_9ACTO|nr:twin-arginine translocase TatA/TatE family subunit [Mobiluncus porci]MDD7542270.1 twin-arginine translocase TatA/TatE family subunit [Mobiluncus porci]MDY5749069.1 twin-arginine translocase TatA/TatE family subunit [Mobiluncus porci]MST50465.1 Sec-independent protein translocase TatA [Mobiluncus porci]
MVPAHVVMMSVSPWVWITVILILVVVFGAAKLPDIARNVGKSAKVLKEELNDLTDDTPQATQTPPAQKEPPQVQSPTQAAPKPQSADTSTIPEQNN